jgi:glutamate 5-kinase
MITAPRDTADDIRSIAIHDQGQDHGQGGGIMRMMTTAQAAAVAHDHGITRTIERARIADHITASVLTVGETPSWEQVLVEL